MAGKASWLSQLLGHQVRIYLGVVALWALLLLFPLLYFAGEPSGVGLVAPALGLWVTLVLRFFFHGR